MKKGRYFVFLSMFLFICGLCIPMVGEAVIGEAAQETVSITEFYNNGVFGSGYEKARKGAVVTISDVAEMKIFLNCLYNSKWTSGISFRQEADISFSNYTFAYDNDGNKVQINQDGTCLEYKPSYGDEALWNIQSLGVADVCVEVEVGRDFLGQYDGQGHSISGFILVGHDPRYSGIFGHMAEQASIHRLKIKNCFLNDACGTFCGFNEGTIEDCSTEYILSTGYVSVGGVAESNGGTIHRCRLDHWMVYSMYTNFGYFGGIVANSYGGRISDCTVEHLLIQTDTYIVDSDRGLAAGGIAGYQTGGQIRNCSSFYEVVYPNRGEKRNIGGIVGRLQDDIGAQIVGFEKRVKSEISNCISAGKLYGETVGGIVGKIELTESASEVLLKNNLSLTRIDGDITGGVVGQLDGGQVITCYAYEPSKFLDTVGQRSAGSVIDCHVVNKEQVYGEASADVIDTDSAYSNTNMLLTALNNGTADGADYLKWKAGVLGYPVLISDLGEAPIGDYELGSEIEVSLPYQPEETIKPSPDAPPDSSVSPSPDVTAPPSNQGDANKENLIKNLAVKNLKAELKASLHVRLSWNKNKWADGYQILRSTKSISGYKVIGRAPASGTLYIDKTAKKGRIYYYMVRGYAKNAGSTVYGNGQKKKIRIAWYQAPSLRLSAGKTSDGKLYVQLGLSKYSGSYIEVYFKVDGKNYIKAPLKNKKIAYYNGKLRFSYKTKSLLYCKVRTYGVKKGKKQYSAFSKERKIRL